MNGYNDDTINQQQAKLRDLFPEVFTEDGINLSQLQAILGDTIATTDAYGLNWKGKTSVFAKIQEKTVETLRPDRDNSVDWDTTSNMFIEGDNLAALKILHKSYYGRVKMIYIDPPYNTGNDFVYNDDFKQTRKSYEAEVGIVDDEGNITRDDGLRANTGGHKHSNWLNMMYPRLFLARNLLRQDGVIFVSIDDNEVHNLRLMMNEIFGEENFVGEYIWHKKVTGGYDNENINIQHEYIVVYARNYSGNILQGETKESKYTLQDEEGRKYKWDSLWNVGGLQYSASLDYPITAPDGSDIWPIGERGVAFWLWSKTKVEENRDKLKFEQKSDGSWRIYKRVYASDSIVSGSMLDKNIVKGNTFSSREMKAIFEDIKMFDYAKPTPLIKYLAARGSSQNDIVLDFFSGSGTTAHAVAELNAEDGGSRQWICVQLPEQTSEKSEAFKAGYTNIADIARERIRRAGAKIRTDFADKLAEREAPLDLGFRAYRVGESNFKPWNELLADPEEIRQQMLDAIDPIEPDATDESILTELLLKRGISPLADIEDRGAYLFVPSANLAIRLAPDLTEAELSEILASDSQTILILARALGLNETLRTNLTLQAEQRGVKVEVV